jgi:hypothetical protein
VITQVILSQELPDDPERNDEAGSIAKLHYIVNFIVALIQLITGQLFSFHVSVAQLHACHALTLTYAGTHTLTYTYTHAHLHTYTHIHTYTKTYTHAHILLNAITYICNHAQEATAGTLQTLAVKQKEPGSCASW